MSKMVSFGVAFVLAAVVFSLAGSNNAHTWVKHWQPFGNGEATVVLHLFCQRQKCQPQSWWPDMIQYGIDQWNNAGANFVFSTRRVHPTDDPCNLPGEVAVIVTDGQVCPGDRALPSGPNTVMGRTVYQPTLQSARIYINAPDSLLYDLIDPSETQLLLQPFFVHEFGHVVGLGHPDEDGQQVSSVMNSRVSLLNGHRLRADDIAGIRALYGVRQVSGPSAGFLENPRDGSSRSGVGVISGWVCEAEEVLIEIVTEDGEVITQDAAYGTERLDTESQCGDANNGFGLLFNWNRLGEGEHEVIASVDGEELGRATVTVSTFGTEFLRGAIGRIILLASPLIGFNKEHRIIIEWDEALQNFVIVQVGCGEEGWQTCEE